MSETTRVKPEIDAITYRRNRDKFGVEELRPYAGQWVAWSLDGTQVVASDADPYDLLKKLAEMGLTSGDVVHECMPEAENFEALL